MADSSVCIKCDQKFLLCKIIDNMTKYNYYYRHTFVNKLEFECTYC